MKTWDDWFYSARIAEGVQVCTEHNGKHQWIWLDATSGFCTSDDNSVLYPIRDGIIQYRGYDMRVMTKMSGRQLVC